MSVRLPSLLRRREAERKRTEAFVAAIRETAPTRPLPVVAVERVDTPHGPVWRLDEASRARLARTDTAELPRIVATGSAPLRRKA
jgi:hypothetical protein